MAIVINTSAGDTSSVNNEMLFVVYESTKANDPTTYPDYSYVCDVYVNSTLIERMVARPDPTHKRGIFDVSRALQPYVSYGLDASGLKVDYTARLEYQLKFGEQYDATLYTNVLVDSTRYAFKTYKPKPFTSSSVIANGKASNMPSTVNWNKDVYALYPYFSNVSGVADFNLKHYTNSGTLLNTYTFTNSDFVANKIRQYNVGNNAYNATSADYAIIDYTDFLGTTQLQRINYQCTKYPVHTLVWLNPYGAYDSQTFGLVSKKQIETTRKEYERLPYEINSSGVVSYSANNVFYGAKKSYGQTIKTRLSLTSHILTAAEYTWLADLFQSTDVYIYDSTLSSFIPVTITENNYEFRTYLNSRLQPLQFNIEYTEGYNSQWL